MPATSRTRRARRSTKRRRTFDKRLGGASRTRASSAVCRRSPRSRGTRSSTRPHTKRSHPIEPRSQSTRNWLVVCSADAQHHERSRAHQPHSTDSHRARSARRHGGLLIDGASRSAAGHDGQRSVGRRALVASAASRNDGRSAASRRGRRVDSRRARDQRRRGRSLEPLLRRRPLRIDVPRSQPRRRQLRRVWQCVQSRPSLHGRFVHRLQQRVQRQVRRPRSRLRQLRQVRQRVSERRRL